MRIHRLLVAALLAVAPAALAQEPPRRYPRDIPFDVLDEALDLDVDLEAQAVAGTAALSIRGRRPDVREVELDAVDLEIKAVTASLEPGGGSGGGGGLPSMPR
jgi:aminopeptidase N